MTGPADERLRRWFRVADDDRAPYSLQTRVAAIPEATVEPRRFVLGDLLGRPRNLILILAAAILAGLLVGAGALAWRLLFPAASPWDVVLEHRGDRVVNNTFFGQVSKGAQPEQILTGNQFSTAMGLAWSPDGDHVAYIVGLDMDSLGVFSGFEIHIADADGRNVVKADVATTPLLPDGEEKTYDSLTTTQVGSGLVARRNDGRRTLEHWLSGGTGLQPNVGP